MSQQTKCKRRHALPRRTGTGRATTSRSFHLSFGCGLRWHDQLGCRPANADYLSNIPRDVNLPVHTSACSQLELSPPVLKPLQEIVNVPDELPASAKAAVTLKPMQMRRREPRGSGRLTSKRGYNIDTGGLAAAYFAAEEAKRQAAEAAARAAAEALARAEEAARVAEAEAAALAAAMEAEKVRAAEEAAFAEAAAAAAQEIAARAVAAAIAAQAAVTPRPTPGPPPPSPASQLSLMTPIEGVPELRSLLRARTAAAAAAAARAAAQPTPGLPQVAFTPVEGVPETARGFRRAAGRATAARASAAAAAGGAGTAPRQPIPKFTPVEGVPERGAASGLSLLQTPFNRRLERGEEGAASAAAQAGAEGDALGRSGGRGAGAGRAAAGVSLTPAAVEGMCNAGIQADMDEEEEQEALLPAAPVDYDDDGYDGDYGDAYDFPADEDQEQQQKQTPSRSRKGQQRQQRATPRSGAKAGSGSAAAAGFASPDQPNMDEAQRAVSDIVSGLATGSPLTPLHPQQLQLDSKGGTPATARNTRRVAAASRAAAAGRVAAVPVAARAAGSSGAFDAAAAGGGGSSGRASTTERGAAAGSVVGSAGEDFAAGVDFDTGHDEVLDQHPVVPQQELPARSAAPQLPHRRASMAQPVAAVAMAAVTAAAAAAFKEPAPVAQQQQEEVGGAAGTGTPAARPQGRSKGVKRKAHTPYEGRMAKQRKSLAGDGLVMDEDGMRRSQRARRSPLEYWRNEKVEYGRDHRTLPTVVGVSKRTPDPQWPLPSTKAARTKARTHADQPPQQGGQEQGQRQQQAGAPKPRSKQRQQEVEGGGAAGEEDRGSSHGQQQQKARTKPKQQQQQQGARSHSGKQAPSGSR